MGSMSAVHWLIVLVIVLLVFGPKRLASLGKGVGEGIKGLREGLSGESEGTDSTSKQIDRQPDRSGEKAEKPRDQTTSSS
jgi:sec-independent protein translocase protein TatA